MSYLSVFDISASGLTIEKARLELVASNLANANSTRPAGETPYAAKSLVAQPLGSQSFSEHINRLGNLEGAQRSAVYESAEEFRLSYEPEHPHADDKGFVRYSNVNLLTEMMTMLRSTRVYEANIKAINAYKAMIQQAMEIGS